jgi:single-strand DNA-binding protein
MLNKVILMGRLCADPELRRTTSGVPVCRIRVAVNRPSKKDTEQKADFINVTCWRTTAEFVARFFSKGKMIIVEGCLRNNDYTDQNGVKHYSMDVLTSNVGFGESKGSGSDASQPQTAPQYGAVPPPNNNPYAQQSAPQTAATAQDALSIDNLGEFEEILSDGEVPF